MIAVDWFGPYSSIEAARKAARADYAEALYVCLGKTSGKQPRSAMQYVGIGQDVQHRLTERHHALSKVKQISAIWLGEIATAEPSGRRLKVTQATLDYSEWMHSNFLDLPLNQRKRRYPDRSVTVLNRWWKTDYETIRRNRPHPDWPDLIDYPGPDLPARLVWFGGRQRLIPAISDD